MHPFDELVAYIGFTEADSAALRALWPAVQPRVADVTGHFYEAIARSEGAARALRDEPHAARLKGTLATWLEQLCNGPHDHAYYARRLRIGDMHVRVGLESRYMFAAMSVMRADLLAIADGSITEAPALQAARGALIRVTDLELAIMVGAYIEQREKALLRDSLERRLPITVLLVERGGRVAASTGPSSPLLTRADVTGIHVREALPEGVAHAVHLEQSIARAMELGETVTITRANVRVAGVERAYRLSVIPIDRSVAHALVHIEDLTETVVEARRVQRAEQAVSLGHLAKTVAHEVRNPLAGISGTVQVVAASMDENDERRHILEGLQGEVGRLGALCADLLAFAQPGPVEARALDLRAIAEAAARQVDGAMMTPSTKVEGVGRAVADSAAVTQVLFNLIENAWQAGARRVVIQVDDGCLRVVDDGPGLPSDVAARLFEPFFTTKVRGTGLGLAITRKLVEAMNGSVSSCASSLNGAGFEIRLPTQ